MFMPSVVRAGLRCILSTCVAAGCAAPRSSFTLSQSGELREVLHEGKTQAKVQLKDVCVRSTVVGVGAVAELDGEIIVLDGEAFVSSVGPNGVLLTRTGADADIGAALLITADVPRWQAAPLAAPVDAAHFDTAIRDAASRAGVDVHAPFPFVISASVAALEGHVIHGACPTAGGSDAAHEPFRLKLTDGQEVTLVGIYAENAAGVITHHDSKTHVHVLTRGNETTVAHVDKVSLRPGASVRFPAAK